MRKVMLLMIIVFIAILSGCASVGPYMQKANMQENITLGDNQAAVVFIKTNAFLGRAWSVPVGEYKNGDMNVVGVFKGAQKMLHITTPGKHEYVLMEEHNGSGKVLKADLKPGKFYYVYIAVRYEGWGVYKFEPIDPNKDEKKLQGYIRNNTILWQEQTPQIKEWLKNRKEYFKAMYRKYEKVATTMPENYYTDSLIK